MNDQTNTVDTKTEAGSVNTEQEIIKAVLNDDTASIQSFVDLAEQNLFDSNLVAMIRTISRDVAVEMAPVNHDAEIGRLQKEMLSTQDTEKRLGVLLEMQELLNQQKNQGSDIRQKLEGVSFEEIAVAYAQDFQALLDAVLVDTLKHHSTDVLKTKGKRGAGASTGTAEKKTGPTVTVKYKDQTLTIAEGRGPLPKALETVIAAYAKKQKVEKVGKADFLAAVKAGEIKDVTLVESEAA